MKIRLYFSVSFLSDTPQNHSCKFVSNCHTLFIETMPQVTHGYGAHFDRNIMLHRAFGELKLHNLTLKPTMILKNPAANIRRNKCLKNTRIIFCHIDLSISLVRPPSGGLVETD